MRQRLRSEGGQAFVEFVIVLPILLTVLFLIIAAGVGFVRFLRVTDAAQSAARAAAVARFNIPPNSTDPCVTAQARALESVGGPGGLPITTTCGPPGQPGDSYTVTVTNVYHVHIPFLPSGSWTIESTATSRLE